MNPKTTSLTKDHTPNEFMTKKKVLDAIRWMFPKQIEACEKNSNDQIVRITALSFAQKDEKQKIKTLMSLNGIDLESATAILTIHDSTEYPSLDRSVYNVLALYDAIKPKDDSPFTLEDWLCYLDVIRTLSRMNALTPREVELRLFSYHVSLNYED